MKPSKKPNILIIAADQQRYDCIGYAGMYPVHTPNIEWIGQIPVDEESAIEQQKDRLFR